MTRNEIAEALFAMEAGLSVFELGPWLPWLAAFDVICYATIALMIWRARERKGQQ